MRHGLNKARRIVVKIGSSLLVRPESDELNGDWLRSVIEDIGALRAREQEVLIVSSGAIALGRRALNLPKGKLKLEQAQAAAAAGQIRLAQAYAGIAAEHGIVVAQILLTLGDTEERRRYLNARSTLRTLTNAGALPVINENDTVATTEIRYGDNDRLAARVAQMTGADCLVLLSDVDGLYTQNPLHAADAEFVHEVSDITPEILAMADAGGPRTETLVGSGGMVTKLAAAQIAVNAGCNMVIASGQRNHPLTAIERQARCTWFWARETPTTSRKQWIAGSLKPQGRLTIDEGAAAALVRGKRSLLPAGVTAVDGVFERGDAVSVHLEDGREIARGLVAYGAEDARLIIGHKSDQIEARLGYRGRDEMIHRDDLVLTNAAHFSGATGA